MTERKPIVLVRESRPLAAHSHTCTICRHPIAIGTRYSYLVFRDNQRSDRHHNLIAVRYHLPACPREVLP